MNHVRDSNRPFLLLKAFPIDAKHQLVGFCYISMSTVLVNVNQPANGMSLWSQMKWFKKAHRPLLFKAVCMLSSIVQRNSLTGQIVANLSYPTDLYWQTWFTSRWLMIDTHLFVCLFLLPATTHVRLKTKHDHYWLSLEITLVRSIKVPLKNYISHLKREIEQFWIGHYFSFSDLLLTIFPCAFTLWKIINVY